MSKKGNRANSLALKFVKTWLGLHAQGVSKRDVFVAAANALCIAHPLTIADGYAILKRFQREFKHSPVPRTKNKKIRVYVHAEASNSLDPNSPDFLMSYEWRRLRMVVLKKFGARCQCCGSSAYDGVRIHVDHVKPRRKFPELALVESNLQVLCEVCNHGKGSWDDTDWRASYPRLVAKSV
jgi:5-methylcytosine-specific restriction endonuclease McrA